jgi:hypothetical protein
MWGCGKYLTDSGRRDSSSELLWNFGFHSRGELPRQISINFSTNSPHHWVSNNSNFLQYFSKYRLLVEGPVLCSRCYVTIQTVRDPLWIKILQFSNIDLPWRLPYPISDSPWSPASLNMNVFMFRTKNRVHSINLYQLQILQQNRSVTTDTHESHERLTPLAEGRRLQFRHLSKG